MPAAESCAAVLLLLAAGANDAPAREAPPSEELLLYLAEFEQDPVALDAAMERERGAVTEDERAKPAARADDDNKTDDDAPR